jgi:hypothetical protein
MNWRAVLWVLAVAFGIATVGWFAYCAEELDTKVSARVTLITLFTLTVTCAALAVGLG